MEYIVKRKTHHINSVDVQFLDKGVLELIRIIVYRVSGGDYLAVIDRLDLLLRGLHVYLSVRQINLSHFAPDIIKKKSERSLLLVTLSHHLNIAGVHKGLMSYSKSKQTKTVNY